MATFSVGPGHPFPAGTSVSVYRNFGQQPSGAPIGNAVTSATVASNSSLTFTGLTEGYDYFAVAQVSGTWRWVSFHSQKDVELDPDSLLGQHAADTTDVHGIPDTSVLRTAAQEAAAIAAHEGDTTNVHGIADTADILLRTLADAKGDILVATAADVISRLAVGSDGKFIEADNASTPGVRWRYPAFAGVVNVKNFGAVGDGVTDDTAAIQAAINSLPASGGMLYFPPGDYLYSTLNLDDKRSIIIQGAGGRSAGASVATRITCTATGSGRGLSCRSSYGFTIRDVWVAYSSGSFTGNLIDFSHSGTGGDGGYHKIDGCNIGGTGSSARSAVGVFANKCQSSTVSDCFVFNCDVGIKGKDVNASYCAGWKILGCSFSANTSSPIRNGGNAWSIRGCVFEPLANGNAKAYDHDTDIGTNGLSFEDNWTGDVASGLGTWVTYAGTGLNVKGNEFQAGATGVSVDNWATFTSEGISIRGNRFNSLTTGITLAANITKFKIGPNAYTSVTNPALANGVLVIEDGADYGTVASAATITPAGVVTSVTGTTTITSVTAAAAGTRITLVFTGALTFTDGSNLKLNGNFVTTADDTITLVSDGTNWYETSRSAN